MPLRAFEYHKSSESVTKRSLQLPMAARLSSPLSITALCQARVRVRRTVRCSSIASSSWACNRLFVATDV